MAVAHGGQIVMSSATAELVTESGFELHELGEHRLAGLSRSERVWQVCAAGLAREFPPLRSVDAMPGNLPRQMTSFVGRDAEVREVGTLVRSRPLVTLTGVGGVGKTRLALEVAAEVVSEFPDGAWLCELAPLGDADAIWETLAGTLRVLPQPGRSFDEMVLEYLKSKRLVLVLDNCEHLLDAVARLVRAIAERCLGVAVLATSREGLAVAGERIVAVPSLGLPVDVAPSDALAEVESVVLFCDRARSVRGDFALTDDNAASVGVLCRRLDGIPLAIELAAARIRALAPEDIVDRLDQRFKLLTRGGRAALERHQTLRNTIDWSYDLLDERERTALNRLSVFAGGCDLHAAEHILEREGLDALDVIDTLELLVDKSLVLADPADSGHVRYRLLETIRQYAQERLEASREASEIRRRHADHFVSVAEAAGPGLRSREQLAWAHAVAPETDNLRAALDWAVETASADHALRLVAPLMAHSISIGNAAKAWAEMAITIPDAREHRLYPDVASWATEAAIARGDLASAEQYAAAIGNAEARLGEVSATAFSGLAKVAMFRGDFVDARTKNEECVTRSRRGGDAYELSQALMRLSLIQAATGSPTLARQSAEEALQVARTAGVPSALAAPLLLVPWSLLDEDAERARHLLDEAIEVGTQLGDAHTVAFALQGKGVYHASLGEWDLALDQVRDSIQRITRLGTVAGLIGGVLGVAAVTFTALGHFEAGAIVLGASYHLAPAAYERPEQLRLDAAATLVDRLGESGYQALFTQGGELSADDALATLVSILRSIPEHKATAAER